MSTPSRRAPRLGPHDRIAPHLKRRGRFAKINPLKARKRPSLARVLGVLGWAGLLGGTLYKAWASQRPEHDGRGAEPEGWPSRAAWGGSRNA